MGHYQYVYSLPGSPAASSRKARLTNGYTHKGYLLSPSAQESDFTKLGPPGWKSFSCPSLCMELPGFIPPHSHSTGWDWVGRRYLQLDSVVTTGWLEISSSLEKNSKQLSQDDINPVL